jgi:hypothetical protein
MAVHIYNDQEKVRRNSQTNPKTIRKTVIKIYLTFLKTQITIR